jgi:hypothetical protein
VREDADADAGVEDEAGNGVGAGVFFSMDAGISGGKSSSSPSTPKYPKITPDRTHMCD